MGRALLLAGLCAVLLPRFALALKGDTITSLMNSETLPPGAGFVPPTGKKVGSCCARDGCKRRLAEVQRRSLGVDQFNNNGVC
jgi:hypothetical protein